MASIIAVACQKGGTGKTTTTLTLGAALGAEKGQRVLLVDLDPQSSLSISAQVDVLEVQRSIYDVLQAALRKPGSLKETLDQTILQTRFENVDIIPATLELANAELELTSSLEREKILKAILAPLRKTYDFILVDCPPSLGLLTVNALVAADQVIVPVEADYLALRGVQLFMETTLPQIRASLNKKLQVAGILLTKSDNRTLHAREVEESLKKQFGKQVFKAAVPHTVKFRDASVAGTTILTAAAKSPAAQAYRAVAQALLQGT